MLDADPFESLIRYMQQRHQRVMCGLLENALVDRGPLHVYRDNERAELHDSRRGTGGDVVATLAMWEKK